MTPTMKKALLKATCIIVDYVEEPFYCLAVEGCRYIRNEVTPWAIHPRTYWALDARGLLDGRYGVLTEQGVAARERLLSQQRPQ